MRWRGVFPAITTPFRPDLAIDFDLLRRQVGWLRCSAGGIRSRFSTRRTADAPTRMPRPSSSPRIRL